MNKITVALIEDHDLTRLSLKTALQGCDEIDWIAEASNGREGLKLLQNSYPDVAIVDIGLPDMNGIDLTRQFKASQDGNAKLATKILILTLHDSQADVMSAFAAGADSYCMKNTPTNLLIEALRATWQGYSWIDPAIAKIVLSQTQSHQVSKVVGSQKSGDNQMENSHPLTERELQVLQLIVDGHSNAEIATKLFITVGTVKTHVRNILNKLCADDRTQAAVHALRSGLVG